MVEDDQPRKHISEALTGRAFVPETHEEREEREMAEGYIEAVAVIYNSLQNEEEDPERKAYFEEQWDRCNKLLPYVFSMSSEERQKIIRDYSALFRQLREERG